MKYSLRLLLLSLAVLLPLAGCDKASPVAPEGTTLTLSASPAEISAANGGSIITVVARKANGQPVTPGTRIRFSTTLGTIDPVVETDRSGVAEATLRGDGRLGTAHITASTGAVRTDPMDVIIGTPARNISLQATPTTLPATGGRVTLLALVRDARGLPLANQGVNFTTQLGTLASRGGLVQTDANGQARDTLTAERAGPRQQPVERGGHRQRRRRRRRPGQRRLQHPGPNRARRSPASPISAARPTWKCSSRTSRRAAAAA